MGAETSCRQWNLGRAPGAAVPRRLRAAALDDAERLLRTALREPDARATSRVQPRDTVGTVTHTSETAARRWRCAGWSSGSTRRSRWPASISTCRPARSSGCWGPTAPARPPPCRWRSGCCGPTPARPTCSGHNVWADPVEAKRRLGVLPDGVRMFDRLSGPELLAYTGLLRGMDAGRGRRARPRPARRARAWPTPAAPWWSTTRPA